MGSFGNSRRRSYWLVAIGAPEDAWKPPLRSDQIRSDPINMNGKLDCYYYYYFSEEKASKSKGSKETKNIKEEGEGEGEGVSENN